MYSQERQTCEDFNRVTVNLCPVSWDGSLESMERRAKPSLSTSLSTLPKSDQTEFILLNILIIHSE